MQRKKTVTLNEASFDEFVKTSDLPVLVDFWAEWCGPCKAMEPVLEEIAADKADRLVVAKVDVDANPGLAARFGILAIPTMILFADGHEIERIRGAMPMHTLDDRLTKHLPPTPPLDPASG